MTHVKPRIVLFIACATFLAFGMFNAAIGPVLNELAARTGSTLAMVGSVLTFLFLGSLVIQFAAGPLTDRFGQRLLFLVSLAMLAVGLAAFTNARSLPLMLALVFLTGMGQGGVDLGANLVVSSAYPKNNTSVLNLLHFFFGLGAFFGPALVGIAIAATGAGLFIHWIAAGVFLVLAVIVFSLPGDKPEEIQPVTDSAPESRKGARVYLSPILWLICFLILVYVGIEYGLGSWTSTYMQASAGLSLQNGALVTSAYWGALTLGRLASAAASRRLNRVQLLGIALTGSLVGTLGLLFSGGALTATILFIILTGFSFGTIYPTTVAVTVAAFPRDQGKAVGLLAAMGSIGGLIFPWGAGILLEQVSPLAYTLFLSVSALILLLIFAAFFRSTKKVPTT